MKNQTKNTFAFSLYYAIKKNFVIPIIGFIGFLICLITNFSYIKSEIYLAKEFALKSNQDFREILRQTIKYVFIYTREGFGGSDGITTITPFVAIIGAALLGIILFRFVSNKKTVNVYYSLGIKRVELYAARYLAGIIMLFAAIALPLLIMTFVNIYYFGSSVMLWKAFFFYLVHFCVLTFASFSIAAAVSGCVGTVIESVGFSALLIAFPSAIKMCINEAFPYMLFGATRNTYRLPYEQGSILQQDLYLSNSFLGNILNNVDLATLNSKNWLDAGCVIDANSLNAWKSPSLTPYIFWILGSIAFFFFGMFMFKNKKAETCGFTGRNKVLNFISSSIISFVAFSTLVIILGDYVVIDSENIVSFNIWNRALIGIVVSFLVFTIVELLLTHSFKAYKKNIKIAPVHIILMLLLVFSLHLGFFGYSSYIPKLEDIKSVKISMPATFTGDHESHITASYMDYGWLKELDEDIIPNCYYLSGGNGCLIEGFKSDDDIKKITTLHQKIIDGGYTQKEKDLDRTDYSKRTAHVDLAIIYELKDGSTVIREYQRLPLDIYENLFTIEDSDKWNEIVEDEFSTDFYYSKVPVLFSKQMDKKTFVDENLIKGLGNALAKDIKELDYSSFWRSDAEWLGAVVLYDNLLDQQEKEYYYYDGTTTVSPEPHDKSEDVGVDVFEEIAKMYWKTEGDGEYTALLSERQSCHVVPITSQMKNTIAFMRSNGLYDALSDDSPVVSAKVIDATQATTHQSWVNSEPIFNGFWDNGKVKAGKHIDEYGDYHSIEYTSGDYMPDNAITVTDKELIKELQNNAYGLYLDIDGGYIVELTRANGCATIMFVPNGRISQEIK